jgi:hypothetical protein
MVPETWDSPKHRRLWWKQVLVRLVSFTHECLGTNNAIQGSPSSYLQPNQLNSLYRSSCLQLHVSHRTWSTCLSVPPCLSLTCPLDHTCQPILGCQQCDQVGMPFPLISWHLLSCCYLNLRGRRQKTQYLKSLSIVIYKRQLVSKSNCLIAFHSFSWIIIVCYIPLCLFFHLCSCTLDIYLFSSARHHIIFAHSGNLVIVIV